MSSSVVTTTAQAQGVRHSVRQTRTNPSRTSKTVGRASFFYGQSSTTDAPQTSVVPHGLYPALTHFTDAITALPREFRRHNSLLKEVDAKAWALEENLQQLLKIASDWEPSSVPSNPPQPVMDGAIRDYAASKDASQCFESQEGKNRRLLFDRIRHTVSDLMLTADEKNHVITSANDELDHQLTRLNSIYPCITSEISEEARLGSLSHWAYSNKGTAKAVAVNERPRRETAATNHQHIPHGLHEVETASRSEVRREALARKQRRHHADSDFDETRGGAASRKNATGKVRASAGGDLPAPDPITQGIAGTSGSIPAPPKRRKLEKPSQPAQTGASMERSLSAANNSTGRATSKEAPAADTKKRIRAPSAMATAGRKRNNTTTSAAGSPSLISSPVVGTFNPPRSAPSPGPNNNNAIVRPQSSRAQPTSQPMNGRQRPPSSASNRVNNTSTSSGPAPILVTPSSNPEPIADKPTDVKAVPSKEGANNKEPTPQAAADSNQDVEIGGGNTDAKATPVATTKEEESKSKVAEYARAADPVAVVAPPAPGSSTKSRSSKNSTPVIPTFPDLHPQRSRPSRNTDTGPGKRSHKKDHSTSAAQPSAATAATEDEESSREGDDEDDEAEPRYCYCNEISFGEMVACDNDACPREWFHLSCVGLTKPPGKNVKWYCNECKENMKRGRNAGGR